MKERGSEYSSALDETFKRDSREHTTYVTLARPVLLSLLRCWRPSLTMVKLRLCRYPVFIGSGTLHSGNTFSGLQFVQGMNKFVP